MSATDTETVAVTDDALVRLLSCPHCHGALRAVDNTLACATCSRSFPMVDGIPVFIDLDAAEDAGAEYKRRQIEFFDSESEGFEIIRPHGTPSLYGWMLTDKLRRGIRGIEPLLPGAVALTVCGGSGMDAEFLSLQGARVITSDISLGAARRAKERAHRYGADILPVVADAEHLPFADRAVDVSFVHDGLHHLSDPFVGLAEMARVSSQTVCVTEPARATATAWAIRLGIALEEEQAGNRVERVTTEDVCATLRAAGFSIVDCHRYVMYYAHEPRWLVRVLSRRRLLRVTQASLIAFNAMCGSVGNKLAVQAVRKRQD